MILRQLFRALLAVLITAFLFLFLLLPVYTVVAEGLNPSLIKEVFSNFIYLEGLVNSFRIAAVTTFMVFLSALPMAFLYDAYEFPGKGLAHLAAMVPMILPPFVGVQDPDFGGNLQCVCRRSRQNHGYCRRHPFHHVTLLTGC